MGPDPFWQRAPWFTRALQLVRQRSVNFSLSQVPPLHLSMLVVLQIIRHPTHTARLGVRGVEHLPPPSLSATSAVCFLCQNCSFFNQLTPHASLELRKTFHHRVLGILPPLQNGRVTCGEATRIASMPETSPLFQPLVLPRPLGLQF